MNTRRLLSAAVLVVPLVLLVVALVRPQTFGPMMDGTLRIHFCAGCGDILGPVAPPGLCSRCVDMNRQGQGVDKPPHSTAHVEATNHAPESASHSASVMSSEQQNSGSRFAQQASF